MAGDMTEVQCSITVFLGLYLSSCPLITNVDHHIYECKKIEGEERRGKRGKKCIAQLTYSPPR